MPTSPAATRARLIIGLVLSGVAFTATEAAAQSDGSPPTPASRLSFTVGAGAKRDSGRYHPAASGALQLVAGRWMSIEGEVTYWSATNLWAEMKPETWRTTRRRYVFVPAANVLFRASTSRITGFAGGGVGVQYVHSRIDEGEMLTFIPNGRLVAVTDTRAAFHLVGGVDLPLGRRMGTWAQIRSEFLPHQNFGVAAGVRTTLAFAAPAAPFGPGRVSGARVREGQEIRVTTIDGARMTGRFVSMSETELVWRRATAQERVPLNRVRRIELVSHHARNGALIGLAAGIGVAFAACTSDDNFCGDDAGFGLLSAIWGSIGAGSGAGLGALINVSTGGRHLIYSRPDNVSVHFQPIAGPHHAGGVLRLRW